jgi:hypothetical protein
MDIFKWLDDTSFVSSYIINDFRKSETAFYLNLKINFINNSELHVREYVDADHRKYSFHWQSSSGELITSSDNAPHYFELLTFPHHKHLASGIVSESHDIFFDEVVGFIKFQILV